MNEWRNPKKVLEYFASEKKEADSLDYKILDNDETFRNCIKSLNELSYIATMHSCAGHAIEHLYSWNVNEINSLREQLKFDVTTEIHDSYEYLEEGETKAFHLTYICNNFNGSKRLVSESYISLRYNPSNDKSNELIKSLTNYYYHGFNALKHRNIRLSIEPELALISIYYKLPSYERLACKYVVNSKEIPKLNKKFNQFWRELTKIPQALKSLN